MLKTIGQIIEIIGAIFGLLCPFCILHWIIKVSHQDTIIPMLSFLDGLWAPVVFVVNTLFHNPVVNGIPLDQAIAGMAYVVIFILLQIVGRALKETDSRIEVTVQNAQTNRNIRQGIQADDDRRERILKTYRPLVYVAFPFQQHMDKAKFFVGFKSRGGTPVQTQVDNAFIEFAKGTDAVEFILEAREQLLNYYQSLRPSDPQPPFQATLVILEGQSQDLATGLQKAADVLKSCGPNDILMSGEFKALLDAASGSKTYQFYSLGEYTFGNSLQEIFRLQGRVQGALF